MPTFVQSAMNPNGTWQADAMDQSEQANRQAAFQQALMQNNIAAEQLRAQLDRARMSQQGSQFEEGRADQLGMHNSTLLNENNMQQDRFGHEDNAALARAAVEKHIADMQFGPESLAQRQYTDSQSFNNRMLDMLSGHSTAQGGTTPVPQDLGGGRNPTNGEPLSAENPYHVALPSPEQQLASQAPGGSPMPTPAPSTTPSGGIDPGMLQRLAVMSSLRNGTPIPNFAEQGMHMRAEQMGLDRATREDAGQRIQAALDAGDVNGAKNLAASSGAQMPRIDAMQVANRPDVQLKLSALDTLAARATQAYNDPQSVQTLKAAMADATATLVNHGVTQDEADALVKQRVLQKIPQRYSGLSGALSDMSYLMAQPEIFGQSSKADRVNQIHDSIGQ